jgi:hypothetical protein
VFVAVWAALSWLWGDEPTIGGRVRSPGPASSPSPAATSPFADPNARSVDEFRVIYEELDATVARAYDEYRPELLDDVFGPDCPETCAVASQKQVIQEMAAAKARFQGFGPQILFVAVVRDSTGDVAVEGRPARTVGIRVIEEQSPYVVVGPDGSVLGRRDGWKRSVTYSLSFSSDRGHWQIFDVETGGGAGDFPGRRWR